MSKKCTEVGQPSRLTLTKPQKLESGGTPDLREKTGETPVLRSPRLVRMLDGRTHRCRASANPSDRLKAGRPKRGQGVPWLRAYLCAIAKRGGGWRQAGRLSYGRHWWIELDLNRCFNAKGYSLSWGRELFRRLLQDPFFRNLCKVRYVQKRLAKNGCFIILIAWRPYLKWDEEPLFYLRDRRSPRHVRSALRTEDLELVLERNRDCPVIQGAHTNSFSSFSTAVQSNNGASAEDRESGSAAASRERFAKSVPPGQKSELRISLNNSKRALRGKAIWLSYQLQRLHWSDKVPFSRKHAIVFSQEGIEQAYTCAQITAAWQLAIEKTHADVTDGIAHCAVALCLWHARRSLAESDSRPFEERFRAFYGARRRRTGVSPVSNKK